MTRTHPVDETASALSAVPFFIPVPPDCFLEEGVYVDIPTLIVNQLFGVKGFLVELFSCFHEYIIPIGRGFVKDQTTKSL